MKKVYQVPEVECISLVPEEDITTNKDIIGGDMGDASNNIF